MFFIKYLSLPVCFLDLGLIHLVSSTSTNSYVQILIKKQADCKILIEKSRKEAEKNTLNLKNKVDAIEKKLTNVDEYVNENCGKKEYQSTIEQLELKEDQYYIDEFSDNKDFPTSFAKARERYLQLGQHAYPRQLDFKRSLHIKRGTTKNGNKYIYFGQLAEGTDKEDGVGIRVYSTGGTLHCNNKVYTRDVSRITAKIGSGEIQKRVIRFTSQTLD